MSPPIRIVAAGTTYVAAAATLTTYATMSYYINYVRVRSLSLWWREE